RGIEAALGPFLPVPPASADAGYLLSGGVLHPTRRPLTPELIVEADRILAGVGTTREDFDVRVQDGVLRRGWKVRPVGPNGDWVLLYHSVSDNRIGMFGHAQFLLRHGFSPFDDGRARTRSERRRDGNLCLERAAGY